MHKAIFFLAVVLAAQVSFAQTANTIKLIIKNKDTQAVVAEATVAVKDTDITAVSDTRGRVELKDVPTGEA